MSARAQCCERETGEGPAVWAEGGVTHRPWWAREEEAWGGDGGSTSGGGTGHEKIRSGSVFGKRRGQQGGRCSWTLGKGQAPGARACCVLWAAVWSSSSHWWEAEEWQAEVHFLRPTLETGQTRSEGEAPRGPRDPGRGFHTSGSRWGGKQADFGFILKIS